MNHMKAHVAAEHNKDGHTELCQYCLKMFATPADVDEHLLQSHPMQTREGRSGFKCVLCTVCFECCCWATRPTASPLGHYG